MKYLVFALVSFCLFLMEVSRGESPNVILQTYEKEARQDIKDFKGFSKMRGQNLYQKEEQTSNGVVSCSTCHTQDPRNTGRTRANKDIEPLAPAAYSRRFTDLAHVEKWFARNCDDVLKRPCSLMEKGDFITYLLSIK